MRARLFSLLLLGPAVVAGDPLAGPMPSQDEAVEPGPPAAIALPASAPAASLVYGFDDISTTLCIDLEGGVYQDLTFVPASAFAVCSYAMIGDASGGQLLGLTSSSEGRVILGGPTDHVEIQAYPLVGFLDTVMRAYDEAGALIASVRADQVQVWQPLSVRAPEGRRIASIGLMGVAVLDDLAVAGSGPSVAEDCRSGGWEAFGFRNQGQCVRFVQTGKDSRP